MTDNTLRNAIARAISPDWWSDGIAVENREVKQEISLQQADAVLKVLAVLGQEFAHGRPASMPDMSGRQQWTIVGGPYGSRDVAERMAKTRPVVKDLPVTVLTRIVSEWEEADDE